MKRASQKGAATALSEKPQGQSAVDELGASISEMNGDVLFHDLPSYPLFLSHREIDRIFDDEFYLELIHSTAFQRLKKISFLGAIDYLRPYVNSNEPRHSRFQHSLGVASLALRYARFANLPKKTERTLVAAALLHDIGHGPLSHSMEPFFQEEFGIEHHEFGRRIIMGESKIGNQITGILESFDIDPQDVINFIEGHSDSPHSIIFSNPLNIDTLDGITRCAHYLARRPTIIPAVLILDSILRWNSKSIPRCDSFWHLKNRIYNSFILSGLGLIADHMCTLYAEEVKYSFSDRYFLFNDKRFRKYNRNLFARLKEIRKEDLHGSKMRCGEFESREYMINSESTPSSIHDLHSRYQHKKTKSDLYFPRLNYEKMVYFAKKQFDEWKCKST